MRPVPLRCMRSARCASLDAHLLHGSFHGVNGLLHVDAPNRTDATHPKGVDLGEFSRVENESSLLGQVVKRLEVIALITWRMKRHNDRCLDRGIQKRLES